MSAGQLLTQFTGDNNEGIAGVYVNYGIWNGIWNRIWNENGMEYGVAYGIVYGMMLFVAVIGYRN